MKISVTEGAPVMLRHMAFELAVKLAVELLAGFAVELLIKLAERIIAADASIYQQDLLKIPIASY